MKKILYAGAEVMPFAATGGLGDVLGSLPAAVKRKNPDCDVRVVMPLYGQVKAEWRSKMTFVKYLMVPLSWRSLYCGIFSLKYAEFISSSSSAETEVVRTKFVFFSDFLGFKMLSKCIYSETSFHLTWKPAP